MANRRKICCYVDETGQDTDGAFFLVSTVIVAKEAIQKLTNELLEIERHVGKRRPRWAKNDIATRIAYLERILALEESPEGIYYTVYTNSRNYTELTAHAVSQSIQTHIQDPYQAFIEIDGFDKAELHVARRIIKNYKIKYRKLRGPRDENRALIRLADSMAGFLRDHEEGKSYAQGLYQKFLSAGFVMKLT